MYQHTERKAINPQNPYLPKFYGTFEQFVVVGGVERRFLLYIPEDVRESTAGVLVLGENGKTADELWRDSSWRTLADSEEHKEKLIAVFLEPLDGIWHTDEAYGKMDGDVAYINAVYLAATQRYLCCIHESKVYLAGCREGGVLAHMTAMYNPAVYAGVATLGGSAVSQAYMQAAAQDFCTTLHGFIDESHRKNIRKGEVPMPAWIIDDAVSPVGVDSGVATYWRTACGTEAAPRQIELDTLEYFRITEVPYAPNQEKEAFRVCVSLMKGASTENGKLLWPRIWKDFLYRQRRWMSSPVGDLRVTRDPVQDLGMEYHFENVDGWMREWYVYVPQRVRQAGLPAPLVLAMHGYTCSGEIYIGNAEWHKVADQYGFIVVYPTALYGNIEMENKCIDPDFAPLPAWNIFEEPDRPDELHFIETLLERVSIAHHIDPARVYATGHSWGSLMTQMLALALPQRFAAVAPCSGVFFGGAEKRMLALPCIQNRPDVEMPIWMFCGEEEAFLIDAVPKMDNATSFNIEMWLRNNHMEAQIPQKWENCRPEAKGRWNDRVFSKGDAPLVRFTSVDYMPHATMAEMSFRIWEEHFARFSRENASEGYKPTR